MPKRRPPHEVWAEIRWRVWERDQHRCVRCVALGINEELPLVEAHIDHVVRGQRGTNRRHHGRRADGRQWGGVARALCYTIHPDGAAPSEVLPCATHCRVPRAPSMW